MSVISSEIENLFTHNSRNGRSTIITLLLFQRFNPEQYWCGDPRKRKLTNKTLVKVLSCKSID